MISVSTILTISSYEAKVLSRNWFFRIVALLGIGFITIFNLAVFSELSTPRWRVLSNSWILPYATLIMISIPQVAAVIFLATGVIKKDKKLDTNEVFFVRPITNLDYVLGKALALIMLFLFLNLLLLCIPLLAGLTSPFATLNPKAFLLYPLLTSLPSIVFTTGISFFLVTLIRNQPIAIVLLIGMAGVQLIYYFDHFSNILDFTAFRLSMLASDITGFVDIEFALWQRAFYFVTGIAFLFLTAVALDRLSSHGFTHKATGLIGVGLLVFSSLIMAKNLRQDLVSIRQEMITVNGKWSSVPNVDVVSHAIDLEWDGHELVSTSEILVKNNTRELLDTIFFTLNPDLTVNEVVVNDEARMVDRTLQILSIHQGISIAPAQELRIRIKYRGQLTEAIAHLDVDQKRYESANDFLMFALKKKYGYLEEDYVLLTEDLSWYPDTQVGFNRKAPGKSRSFVDFQLSVKVPPGKTPISQGALAVRNDAYHFDPEYLLPHISLVIGDFQKKKITVAGVEYSVFHNPKSNFFDRHLDQIADTLNHLISDVVHEYEDAQKLSYPFKRLQFVEVPLQFTAYDKIYESHQAYLQPETVFWPEEGGGIEQFDFRRQLRDMDRQAANANQVMTDKQKQSNVFNDLIRKVFTKQSGSTWVYEGRDADNPDYAIFPNYYDFNSGIVSKDWPLLNRSIATYLRNDKQTQKDYSRNIDGISFTEECNNLMRTSSMSQILTEAEFNKITKSVSLKSQYLFAYLGHILGESNFKSFLYGWVNRHQHQLDSYDSFRKAIMLDFRVDIDPIIQRVYSEISQPAFEILDLQKYEVMDGDKKRYQVLVEVRNSGDSDGVIKVDLNARENDDDDYGAMNVNEVEDEAPGRLAVIKRGETKVLGFVLDEKPENVAVNTLVSKNIPSVITMSLGALPKREGGILFEGERVIERKNESLQYEVIIDNEDPAFTHFSPIKPTMLRAYLDSRSSANQKYYGSWSSSYSKWLPTTGSDFYGRVIRSAHFTRSGNGEKIATWTPKFQEDGFYDVYIHMRGKNQNEFQGRDGGSKQFTYHFIINNADGTDNINYNITNAEPGWNYLGSYYFTKTGGSVSLTDECELRTVYADAVKWVKQ